MVGWGALTTRSGATLRVVDYAKTGHLATRNRDQVDYTKLALRVEHDRHDLCESCASIGKNIARCVSMRKNSLALSLYGGIIAPTSLLVQFSGGVQMLDLLSDLARLGLAVGVLLCALLVADSLMANGEILAIVLDAIALLIGG